MRKITSKFVNTVIKNVINNEEIKMDIENEINMLILKYLPNEFSEQEIQNIKINVVRQITNIGERLQNNLLYSFGEDYSIVLKTYNVVTNIYFRIIIAILLIINITILCMLEKYKVLKSMKNISLVITIFMLVVFVSIKLLFNFIDQRLAGGWLQQINTDSLIVSIIIGIIIIISLIIIDKIVNEKLKRKKQVHKF
ncbi:MAG: hypothetical protein Q4G05_06500 [Clostridia bacterium]|nr:hypothetical protein [Clostridia bacterium]